ncbi:MAG: hypothetical protein HY908_33110 [Myxococcales bacterium]|nr:hypothetical protein [Myxococcales bacterium]
MTLRGAWLGLVWAAVVASVATVGTARAGDAPEPADEAASAAELLARGDAESAAGRAREAAATYRRALRAANLALDVERANEAYLRMAAAEARADASGAAPPSPPPAELPTPPAPATVPTRASAVLLVAHAPGGATLAFGDGAPGPIHGRYLLEPGTVELVLRRPGERARRRTITLQRDREHAIDLALLERWPIDPPPQPVSFVRRPLTQPDETVSVEGSVYYAHAPGLPIREIEGVVGNAWDVRFGILDDLELELAMSFMMYLPSDPLVGVRGRLLDGDLELALSGQLRPPLFFWAVGVGLPGAYFGFEALGRLGRHVRLDTGLGLAALLSLWRGGSSSPEDGGPIKRPALLGLVRNANVLYGINVMAEPGIPLSFTFAPVEELALRLGTGVGIVDFEVPSSLFLPLEARIAVTAPHDGAPGVDIETAFAFPFLVTPVVAAANEHGWWDARRHSRRVLPEWWQVTLAVRVQAELGN